MISRASDGRTYNRLFTRRSLECSGRLDIEQSCISADSMLTCYCFHYAIRARSHKHDRHPWAIWDRGGAVMHQITNAQRCPYAVRRSMWTGSRHSCLVSWPSSQLLILAFLPCQQDVLREHTSSKLWIRWQEGYQPGRRNSWTNHRTACASHVHLVSAIPIYPLISIEFPRGY